MYLCPSRLHTKFNVDRVEIQKSSFTLLFFTLCMSASCIVHGALSERLFCRTYCRCVSDFKSISLSLYFLGCKLWKIVIELLWHKNDKNKLAQTQWGPTTFEFESEWNGISTMGFYPSGALKQRRVVHRGRESCSSSIFEMQEGDQNSSVCEVVVGDRGGRARAVFLKVGSLTFYSLPLYISYSIHFFPW